MQHWQQTTIPPTITLTAENEEGETIVIASPAQICFLLASRYGSMLYHCYPQFDTVESCGVEFQRDWSYEAEIYTAMIQKWYDVMSQKYDPLANYDRDEKATSWIGSRETKREYDEYKVSTTGGTHEITYQDATYESDPKDREMVTDVRTVPADTSYTGSYTDTESQTMDNATHNNVIIKGNVGVTTSQQMAEAELSLRQFNILVDFLAMFLRHHCYSVGGCNE